MECYLHAVTEEEVYRIYGLSPALLVEVLLKMQPETMTKPRECAWHKKLVLVHPS